MRRDLFSSGPLFVRNGESYKLTLKKMNFIKFDRERLTALRCVPVARRWRPVRCMHVIDDAGMNSHNYGISIYRILIRGG